jgi:type IV pilus assembly protein PilB
LTGRSPLESALLAAGVLDEERLGKARSLAQSRSLPLERAVLQLALAPEADVWRALAKTAGLQFVDPAKARPDAVAAVPREQIEQNQALPVLIKDGCLWVAIDDPLRTYVADSLAFVTGREVRCALAPPQALKDAIRRHAGGAPSAAAGPAAGARGEKGGDDDAPIIRLVEKLIEEAVDARASDIHVEPYETDLRIRYRIDGVLRDHQRLDRALHGPLSSRLKIMAALDIAEKRKPQDGRIDFRATGRAIDIRTSLLPSNHGETIVMRLLDKERNLLSLPALGFDGEDRDRFEQIIRRPNGVVLVTGPTGSGKTTTLYAALRQLNRPDVKIITAEDPVEFNLAGINQCQVKAGIGLTFARILRAMLRQAPNIILVGEIRDRETAEIAIQAALTGHLVFSTLHTNDAPSAVTRLIDMGVKPFLVSAAVQAIMAQRLVRVLCEQCKRPYEPTAVELRSIGVDPAHAPTSRIHRAVGCEACERSGYRGRLGIFELMRMDNELREMTFRGEPALRLREYARTSGGMRTLVEDGVRKVLTGATTIDELLRVTAAV